MSSGREQNRLMRHNYSYNVVSVCGISLHDSVSLRLCESFPPEQLKQWGGGGGGGGGGAVC